MRPKLSVSFDCPFCGHEKTCDVKIDKDRSFGQIKCNICGAEYATNTHRLTQPVDVYAEWIDECDAVNAREEGEGEDGAADLGANGASHGPLDDEEDDGFADERQPEDREWRREGDEDDEDDEPVI